MTDPLSFQGVHVAITGGARGIGAATAERLLRDGARVTLGDVDVTAVEATAARLGAVGLGLDVTERRVVHGLSRCRRGRARSTRRPDQQRWDHADRPVSGGARRGRTALAFNVHGVILGMKIALPRMLARGSGNVVNLASAAGRMASLPGESTYVATKHAVVGLSEAVRCELEGTGVGVMTVLPNLASTTLGPGCTRRGA